MSLSTMWETFKNSTTRVSSKQKIHVGLSFLWSCISSKNSRRSRKMARRNTRLKNILNDYSDDFITVDEAIEKIEKEFFGEIPKLLELEK